MKKIYKFMMLLIMLVSVFALTNIGVLEVQAASPSIDKTVCYYVYKDVYSACHYEYIKNPVSNGKITKLKNTNPNVVQVEADNQWGCLKINIIKAGTTKVSFRYAGKTFTQKITIINYENPCQLFKIGNTNYVKYFKNKRSFSLNRRKKDITTTINIEPKKGWKVTKIEVQNMYTGTKRVKNHSKITLSLKGTGTGVNVYFKNIKTGIVQQLSFGYSGQDAPNFSR